jgi:hypothetical protein
VRILICDPNSKLMEPIENLVDSRNTSQRIEGTLGMLQQMRESIKLSEKDKHNLEIRTYDVIPTHSMIILDPATDSIGVMQIEPYAYETAQEERGIFMILKRKQKKLFEVYSRAFNNMWNKGKEYKFHRGLQHSRDSVRAC